MNFAIKWFSDYGWLIFFIISFLLGIFFIFWMGSAEIKAIPTSEITEIKQYILDKKSPSTSEGIDLGNISLTIKPIPSTPAAQSPSPDTAKELDIEIVQEEELNMNENDLCPTLLIKRGNKVMLFNKNVPETPGENPIFFDNLEQYIQYVKKQRELYNQSCPVLFLQEENNAQGQNVYKMRTLENVENVDPLLLGSIQDYFLSKTNVMPKFGPPAGPSAFNQPAYNSEISLANYSIPYQNLPPQFKNQPPLVPYADANRDNKPYNQGYYGFDPTSQYVGKYTVLDEIHNSTMTQNQNGLSNNPMDPNWGGVVFTEQKIDSGMYEGNNVQPPTVPTVLQS